MHHIVYIPFRGVGIDLRNDEWFEERIGIFKKFTLQSLKNQSDRDFTLWLSFRPEDAGNPLVVTLYRELQQEGMRPVFTFNGLMYVDDKYGGTLIERVWNAGRLARAAYRSKTLHKLPSALWQMLSNDKNNTLPQRLAKSLSILQEEKQDIVTQDEVLLTRIDSDDMFHRKAVEQIKITVKTSPYLPYCVRAGNGYIYDSINDRMAYWEPATNPPFHTLIFTRNEFFDAQKHIANYRGYRSHEDIAELFPDSPVLDGIYCIVTHNPGAHISTVFNHPYRGDLIRGLQKMAVLGGFLPRFEIKTALRNSRG